MANEKRLIDANALVPYLWALFKFFGSIPCTEADKATQRGIKRCIGEIKKMPTVDAVEVVHAQWLYDSGSGKYFCSACDEYALSFKKDTLYGGDLYEVCLTDYCPNCGAKMDGDGNGT